MLAYTFAYYNLKYESLFHVEPVFFVALWYNISSSNLTTGNRDTGWLTFILHRMEVMLMKNKFDFGDLMSFGMFLLALLTFIFLICH